MDEEKHDEFVGSRPVKAGWMVLGNRSTPRHSSKPWMYVRFWGAAEAHRHSASAKSVENDPLLSSVVLRLPNYFALQDILPRKTILKLQ